MFATIKVLPLMALVAATFVNFSAQAQEEKVKDEGDKKIFFNQCKAVKLVNEKVVGDDSSIYAELIQKASGQFLLKLVRSTYINKEGESHKNTHAEGLVNQITKMGSTKEDPSKSFIIDGKLGLSNYSFKRFHISDANFVEIVQLEEGKFKVNANIGSSFCELFNKKDELLKSIF